MDGAVRDPEGSRSHHQTPLGWSARALTRRNHLGGQVALLLVLTALAGGTLGAPFLAESLLSNDRLTLFGLYRDILHSLNRYGEFPWWNPAVQVGFPFYYLWILGWTALTPVFLLTCAAVWSLGRLGVTVPSYLTLYVIDFAFLTPLLLSAGVLALARQILRDARAVYGVVVLAAFSPGVLFSFSDGGIEETALGLWFAAAFLRWLRQEPQDRAAFPLLLLAVCVLCLGLNHLFLYWNVLFVPMFVAACLLVRSRSEVRLGDALRCLSPPQWVALLGGALVCALPALLTYTHGTDIVRTTTGTRVYSLWTLRPGNPLEVLALSTPGIGFEWTDYGSPDARFAPRAVTGDSGYLSYGYMGLLTLPLALLGFVSGREPWRTRLLLLASAGAVVLMLSAYSPLFAPLIAVVGPLRAVNHYSDALFRIGLFAVFLLGAGLGLEALLRLTPRGIRSFGAVFGVSAAGPFALLLLLEGRAALGEDRVGLAAALFLLYAVGLARLRRSRGTAQRRIAWLFLAAVMLADVSAFASMHVRRTLLRHHAAQISERSAAGVGTRHGHEDSRAQTLLHLRGLDETSLRGYRRLPLLSLREPDTDEALPAGPRGVRVLSRSYSSLHLAVDATRDGRLVWKDAYSPFWTASVNGVAVPVEPGLGPFKAVPVPGGRSEVRFRFSPGAVPYTILAAVAACLAAAVSALISRQRAP